MKLYGLKKVVGEGLVTVSVILGVGVVAQLNADASTYQDGTYSIPIQVLNKDTGAPSISQQFFNSSATGTVTNDNASMSFGIKASGQPYMRGTQVDGQDALSADHSTLNYTVPVGTPTSRADFQLDTPIASMNESADFSYDWSGVPLATTTSTQTGATNSTPTQSGNTTSTTTTTTPTQNNATNTSSSTTTNQTPAATTPNTSSETKAQFRSMVSEISYQVLQADGKSTSEASQYYTHVADVEKLSNGSYKVTMHVTYGKNIGMEPKGFVPLTVNGVNVSDVQYGSSGNNYTNSFSFVVPSLDALTKGLVSGTIHVSVPFMNISQDFTINYAFAATSDSTSAKASSITQTSHETGITNTQKGTTTAQTGRTLNDSQTASAPTQSAATKTGTSTDNSKGLASSVTFNEPQKTTSKTDQATGELPQTSEKQTAGATILGLTGLSLLLGTFISKRKKA